MNGSGHDRQSSWSSRQNFQHFTMQGDVYCKSVDYLVMNGYSIMLSIFFSSIEM